jgi:predicted TPR repeat methyltransferase
MASCCSPGSYGEVFGAKQARRDASRYRKKGLDETAELLVENAGEVEGATVLEVGGGVGAIGLEYLKRGASRATNVELSAEYDAEARQLAHEVGVEERVERQVGNFARDDVARADIVALHRVVCCYPDYEELLAAASEHAQQALVFSFPRETWWWRLGVRTLNASMRLRRRQFRAYVHPVAGLLSVPAAHGLSLEFEREGRIWRMAGFRRRNA